MNIEITKDFQVIADGENMGQFQDVIMNHIAAIDPENPTDSLVYQVASRAKEFHEKSCSDIRASFQPATEEEEAQAMAERVLRQRRIEERAKEIIEAESKNGGGK